MQCMLIWKVNFIRWWSFTKHAAYQICQFNSVSRGTERRNFIKMTVSLHYNHCLNRKSTIPSLKSFALQHISYMKP